MGGGTIFGFYEGDTAVMKGDIELMGSPPVPSTRENPGLIFGCTLLNGQTSNSNHFIVVKTPAWLSLIC